MRNVSKNVSPEPYTDYIIAKYDFFVQMSDVLIATLIDVKLNDTKGHHQQE